MARTSQKRLEICKLGRRMIVQTAKSLQNYTQRPDSRHRPDNTQGITFIHTQHKPPEPLKPLKPLKQKDTITQTHLPSTKQNEH